MFSLDFQPSAVASEEGEWHGPHCDNPSSFAYLEESRTCLTETGGMLIGTVRRPTVLIAGDPGPQSRKTTASFTTDPKHDRQVLERA